MKRYVLMVQGFHGRSILPVHLGWLEAPVVMLDQDTLAMYTPIRWVRVLGALQ